MTIRAPIRTHFYGGSGGVSSLVPRVWDCAIGGRTYMFDTKFMGTAQFARSSIPLLRAQQSEGTVNEDSLNPADGARAKVESWHHGAGQTFLDRPESDPYRFRSSKGVDPWTRYRLSLLHDTDQKVSTSGTNLHLAVAGSRLYFTDGQTTKYVTDLDADSPAATTVTATPAATATSIASDGFNVWTAYTASGLYATDTSTGAASQLVSTALAADSVVGYVKGRLMVSKGAAIYNVTTLTGTAALPAALFTHANSDFKWVGFAEGQAVLYAAGYSGDKSFVFKTSVKPDGTALDVPTVAGELPDGEIIRSISSYLGVVLLGTGKGWWTAAQDSNGNLTLNKVQATSSAVLCFEGQGDFIWYGWSNYDATSTGLGRADLRTDTKGAQVVTPGYASDLMVTAQGAVQSVATFDNLRVFTVSGSGVWAESADLVASGTIDSGLITHGMPDAKVALTISLTHEPLDGSIGIAIAAADESFTTRGSSAVEGASSATLSAGSLRSEAFELRHTLTRSAVTTVGPILTRTTLESNLAPGRGRNLNVALLIAETIQLANEVEVPFDVAEEYAALEALLDDGGVTTYQDCLGAESVTVEDADYIPEGFTSQRDGYRGTYLIKFRRGRRRS